MPALEERVGGYVLAGGQSSRMGRDKAEVRLGGRPLLAWAVALAGEVTGEAVAVVGPERAGWGDGVRWFPDRRPGMGPVAGLEVALEDAAERGRTWVLLLPVDVPLLPAGLLRLLLERWVGATGCWAGYPVVEGQAQPAIAAVHVRMLPAVQAALDRGERRLRRVLEEGAAALAGAGERGMCVEAVMFGEGRGLVLGEGAGAGWVPEPEIWRRRAHWFANVNTAEELGVLEELLAG